MISDQQFVIQISPLKKMAGDFVRFLFLVESKKNIYLHIPVFFSGFLVPRPKKFAHRNPSRTYAPSYYRQGEDRYEWSDMRVSLGLFHPEVSGVIFFALLIQYLFFFEAHFDRNKGF